MAFSEDFVWGAATASYQVEGTPAGENEDASVWDMLCRQPGRIWSGDTGFKACNHVEHLEEDVSLMKRIGLQGYRFSISWPRVIPAGTGAVSAAGLDFYDRLVDALLENGIQPWATLFHWDYPYDLFLRGGWLQRDSAEWFADYTRTVAERLADRVAAWMTLNEPQCFIGGHLSGVHAPGLKLGMREVLQAAHHALMAHGRAVQVLRAVAPGEVSVGAAPVGVVKIPASGGEADIAAARNAMFEITAAGLWNNTWFADPVVLGGYPADGMEVFADVLPRMQEGDLDVICQPLDFYGANIYNGQTVRAAPSGGWEAVPPPAGPPLTTMTWRMTPAALYWGPRFLQERYRLPIVITENGMANCDWVQLDGRVHDPQRIDFVTRYLRELRRACRDGVDVRGYFLWTLMDNFEWAHGYRQRFGLIHVDFADESRTIKDSGYWYRDVIASNGALLGEPCLPDDWSRSV